MARRPKQRCICSIPQVTEFAPQGCTADGCVELTYDEYEVIRLLDNKRLTQEQCSQRMNISRPTVTRIYDEARRKMADMLINGRNLHIGGGDVYVCPAPRPECSGEEHCCHRDRETTLGWHGQARPKPGNGDRKKQRADSERQR